MSERRVDRADRLLIVASLIGAAIFFSTLTRIWPLVGPTVAAPTFDPEQRAREVLHERGIDAPGLSASVRLGIQDDSLNYISKTLGNAAAQRLDAQGYGISLRVIAFKRDGDSDLRVITLDSRGGVIGWSQDLEEDEPGATVSDDTARAIAMKAAKDGLGLDVLTWSAKAASSREHSERKDHAFTWERDPNLGLPIKERVTITVAGDVPTYGRRSLVVPEAAKRQQTIDKSAPEGLEGIGVALVVITAVIAVSIFVRRLRGDALDLARPARWVGALAAMHFASEFLDAPALFYAWKPMWPWWISVLNHFVDSVRSDGWIWLVLFALFGAADSVDKESGARRAAALWSFGDGRLGAPGVSSGLIRGVLLGFVCGGVLASMALGFEAWGARLSLQPRGAFLEMINTSSPALATPLFFAKVAVIEELGYRVFGTTWLLSLTKRRWVAVLVPALIYGLSHAGLTFLPPDEPAWGRVLIMTTIGAIWGVAYLRWGALVVVTAHLFSDTFIFSWPRLATGRPEVVLPALVPLALPLLLAAAGAWLGRKQPDR